MQVDKAAEYMGVTKARVYQMVRSGEIKAHRVPIKGRHPHRLYITKTEAAKHTREARAIRHTEARKARNEAERQRKRLAAIDVARAQEEFAEQWVERRMEEGW
jgi:excisionase family DNA binding protein